ncbi:MAG: hypothetical protein CVV60_01915 [Tenericutes bacterium HGW-Tenericutes-5]|nr:MAG: hypothetical protein CVV60_01915 [Tenericutes bacterium HGW-Tenericutes-5]
MKNHTIYVSRINGNQIILPNNPNLTNKDLKRIFHKNHMDDKIANTDTYQKELFKTIYISLHASSKCNMNCKYCFMQDRPDVNITIDEAKRFIDFIISEFPKAEKFIVDPTGSGEPLLRMQFIHELAKYCHLKSDEICKEVLPMLVTNGTLLTKENVDKLQSAGYIFGISIDGYQKTHDANRLNKKQEGTYKQIISNVKNIKHREYLGVAVTLTNDKIDLVKAFKTLSKYFTTISIKPVRSFDHSVEGINEDNIEEIKHQYTRLYKYILQKTLNGKLDSLGVLLNGDDYFGKFIQRVILNHKVSTRCDAGLGRFSLTPNKKIIACPGSVSIKEMELGTLDTGLNQEKTNHFWSIQLERKHCQDCEARYVCGGECMVVSYYKDKKLDSVDEVMCELKKHLFELAVKLKFELIFQNEELFNAVYEGCQRKADRFQEDKELSATLKKLSGQYTFMELKKIKDENIEHYLRIKEESCENS